jgi:hypothetical protein
MLEAASTQGAVACFGFFSATGLPEDDLPHKSMINLASAKTSAVGRRKAKRFLRNVSATTTFPTHVEVASASRAAPK